MRTDIYIIRMYSGSQSWERPEMFSTAAEAQAVADTLARRDEVVVRGDYHVVYTHGVVERWQPLTQWDVVRRKFIPARIRPADSLIVLGRPIIYGYVNDNHGVAE